MVASFYRWREYIYDRKIHVDIDLHSNLLGETNFSGFISNSGEDVLIANAYSAWTTIEGIHIMPCLLDI